VFSFFIALIHAFCELVVVSVFYFGGNLSSLYHDQGFLTSVLLLVGLGTVIHSMVDFEIARIVLFPLKKQQGLSEYFEKC
jgi:niacin transporter